MDDIVYPEKFFDLIKKSDQIFIEKTPFNKHVGMKVDSYGQEPLKLRVDFRDELVGNYARNMLHGGVTMSLLDTVGGMQVFRAIIRRLQDEPKDIITNVLSKISTINLNVQFVKPGMGDSFYATAQVIRLGRKVAFVDMQLLNQQDELVATGHGIYNVS